VLIFVMKFALLFLIGGFGLPTPVNAQSWQEVSSHLFTNTVIALQASTSQLPKTLWIYRRSLPHVFPATVISNAIVLGSLQDRGFPRPPTKDFYIPKQEPANWPAGIPTIFGILPRDGYLYYAMPDDLPVSQAKIPDDETVARLAIKYAPQLGLYPSMLTERKFYTHWCETDQKNQTVTNFCGRGVFFPRHLDGIPFFSASDDGESAEGFSMEFGEHGKIQAFSVRWSEVKHYKREQIASSAEIIRCLRAHKAVILPKFAEGDFDRLRKLATAMRFTITKITPYYEESIFGEPPTDDVPAQFATPFAELEAVADFGNSNMPVKVLSPILSSEVRRLLLMKNTK